MSTIKKYFRLILCVVGFLLMAIVLAFNPAMSVKAVDLTTQTIAHAVSAVHMPKGVVDVSKGESLVVPLLNFKSDEAATNKKYTIRVQNANGPIDCEIDTDKLTTGSDSDYFSYTKMAVDGGEIDAIEIPGDKLVNGNYSITYIYGDVFYSYPYAVEVKGVNYDLTFKEPSDLDEAGAEQNPLANLETLVPSTAGDGQSIVLPTAYVKVAGEDGEYVKDGEDGFKKADLVVYKDGAPIYSSVTGVKNDEIQVEDGKVTLTTHLGDENTVTYRAVYSYGALSNDKTKIVVLKDYSAPKTLKINTTDFPAMELGQRGITLPEWSADADNISDVNVNITKIVIEKEGNSNIKCELTNNNRTFNFTKETFNAASYKDMVGNYKITYYMESAYPDPEHPDQKLSASAARTIVGVMDKTAPSVHMAYSYELAGGDWAYSADGNSLYLERDDENVPVTVATKQETVAGKEGTQDVLDEYGYPVPAVNTDYAVEFKSNYGYGELVFPAIYAEDLVDGYEDLVLYRYFQRKNDINRKFYIDNVKLDEDNNFVAVDPSDEGYNASNDKNIGQLNRVVRFKFNTSETNSIENFTNKEYTLHYVVIRKDDFNAAKRQENNLEGDYVFKVLNTPAIRPSSSGDDVEGVSTPTIKINDLVNNSAVNADDKLTISVDSSDSLDKRLKNAVFYYTGASKDKETVTSDLKDVLDALVLDETWGNLEDADEDGKPDTTGEEDIDYFTTFTRNILDNETENGLVTEMKTKSYENFTRFTAIDSTTFETQLNLSGKETLNIVAVTLNDNNTIEIAIKTLKVNDDKEILAPKAEHTEVGENSDNKVKTDNTSTFGQEEIVYLPTVKFTDTGDDSLETGVKYYVLSNDSDEVNYLEPISPKYNEITNGFEVVGGRIATHKVGTYYIVYYAFDDAGNQTYVTYSFSVENTTLPTLSINPTGEGVQKSGTTITAEVNSVITFTPTFTDYEGNDVTDDSKVEFKILSAECKGKEYEASPAGSRYARLFEKDGEYEVKFTAMYDGKAIYTEENPYTIIVNITKPEFKWLDFDESLITSKTGVGIGELVSLPSFTAVYGKQKLPINVTVTVKDPEGNTPEWGDAKFDQESQCWIFRTNGGSLDLDGNEAKCDPTRTQMGTYTITYTAKLDGQPDLVETVKISVGDASGPEFRFANDVTKLEQDLVYDGTNDLVYTIYLNRYSSSSKPRGLTIKVTSNGKEIYSVDTGLSIYDKDGRLTNGVAVSRPFTDWGEDKLKVELKTSDGKLETIEPTDDDDFEASYRISGIGKYTLVLTMSDNYNNSAVPKEFNFNVVAKSSPKKNNDKVVGTVLIVISLLILVGVILFFALTGKNNGSSRRTTNKTNKKLEAETAPETDSDAKSGDVE